ncbi:MAG: hypothetical protein AB4911_20315 [Oscillochloridaceae bacterium umkhey_bin13]
MATFPPPTPEEIHTWGWEMGVEAGRRLAEESDAFIGITSTALDTPAAMEIYGRAYLRAFIHGYRTALHQLLGDRADIAAEQRHRIALALVHPHQKGNSDDHADSSV